MGGRGGGRGGGWGMVDALSAALLGRWCDVWSDLPPRPSFSFAGWDSFGHTTF